jgi:DNA (cytosine-5)-methyltransferase 1
MVAIYNEIDPYAGQWLRNLIDAGHIAAGVVDERDIRDIRPSELEGYTQVHFFAGLGGWSRALRHRSCCQGHLAIAASTTQATQAAE